MSNHQELFGPSSVTVVSRSAPQEMRRDELLTLVRANSDPQRDNEITVMEFSTASGLRHRAAHAALTTALETGAEVRGLRVLGRRAIGREYLYTVEKWA